MTELEKTELEKLEEELYAPYNTDLCRLIHAFRAYRTAAKKLLNSRYRDGECDAFSLTNFHWTIEEIENLEQPAILPEGEKEND